MNRICEICGRKEEIAEEERTHQFDMIDVCPDCTNDRVQMMPE